MRVTAAAGLVALALGVLAQGAAAAPRASCPAIWAKGWQVLADKVAASVYCPAWMPNPLDARIGGQYEDIYSIGKDRSYLVSFLEHGDLGSGDVHVNFRGYPGRTRIPRCPAPVGKGTLPCFGDPVGHMSANGIHATVYQDCTISNRVLDVDFIRDDVAVVHVRSLVRVGRAMPAGPREFASQFAYVAVGEDGRWRIRSAQNVVVTDPRTGELVLEE